MDCADCVSRVCLWEECIEMGEREFYDGVFFLRKDQILELTPRSITDNPGGIISCRSMYTT